MAAFHLRRLEGASQIRAGSTGRSIQLSADSHWATLRSALSILVFGVVPAALLVGVTIATIHEGTVAYDFEKAFLPAARHILHGRSPYLGTTFRTLHDGTAFVYPPVAAFLFAPLALLPGLAAGLIAVALGLAAGLGALAALGVRDWRCYSVTLAWAPVFYSVKLGAVSTLLALGVALAWRYRSSAWRSGIAVGLVVALKLFLWPLVLWLCAIRHWRAAAAATAATVVFLVVPWAALGFAGLASYPHVLHELSATEAPESYTVTAAVAKLGGSWSAGQAIGVLAAISCGVAMLLAGRAGRERAALILAVAVALLASPIVWLHYFALLVVVIPLVVPRLHPVWLVPVGLFAFPITPGAATGWEVAGALAIVAALFAYGAATGRGTRRRVALARAPH